MYILDREFNADKYLAIYIGFLHISKKISTF